jgi:hypothetical protein
VPYGVCDVTANTGCVGITSYTAEFAVQAEQALAEISAAFGDGSPLLRLQKHKTARMAQEQQSLASGALLGQLQTSVSARPASGRYRRMYTNLRLEIDL